MLCRSCQHVVFHGVNVCVWVVERFKASSWKGSQWAILGIGIDTRGNPHIFNNLTPVCFSFHLLMPGTSRFLSTPSPTPHGCPQPTLTMLALFDVLTLSTLMTPTDMPWLPVQHTQSCKLPTRVLQLSHVTCWCVISSNNDIFWTSCLTFPLLLCTCCCQLFHANAVSFREWIH